MSLALLPPPNLLTPLTPRSYVDYFSSLLAKLGVQYTSFKKSEIGRRNANFVFELEESNIFNFLNCAEEHECFFGQLDGGVTPFSSTANSEEARMREKRSSDYVIGRIITSFVAAHDLLRARVPNKTEDLLEKIKAIRNSPKFSDAIVDEHAIAGLDALLK